MMLRTSFTEEQNAGGEFVRQEDAFRDWLSGDGSTEWPAVSGRYHLYVSLACPWASRTAIVRKLKGLEQVIGMTVVDPIRDEKGWAFRNGPGYSQDPVNRFKYLSEAYKASDAEFRGRVTVPVLWDTEAKRIINNSEDDICRMLHDAFGKLAMKEADIFPEDIEAEHAKLSEYIYENLNNGVYRAGFAATQEAYEVGCRAVFSALDSLETRLSTRRYLFGNRIVEADWRLFCTLVRFDPVYHGHFKCNVRRITDYPSLQGYLLDLYQRPGIAETVNFDHIKRHYYMTHDDINPTKIVPIGPALDMDRPHGRERLSA